MKALVLSGDVVQVFAAYAVHAVCIGAMQKYQDGDDGVDALGNES